MIATKKAKLIRKHLGVNTPEWIVKNCIALLKEYEEIEWCDVPEKQANVDNTEQKALYIDSVMPRYFIDERAGCAAVRDREHPKYDKDYQGLHQDTPDVTVYAHGFQNHEKGCWEMKDTDINYLKLECDRLNRLNGV